MTHSGNYPIIGGKDYHPDEGHTSIRINGTLYSFTTLNALAGRGWFGAVKEYRRRFPDKTHGQASMDLLRELGVEP